MHVMIHPQVIPGQTFFSAVAFELNGSVLEPHELLQHDDRWFDGSAEDYRGNHFNHLLDLSRFCRRWLGVRGFVWASPGTILDCLVSEWRDMSIAAGYEQRQQLEFRALIWATAKTARGRFRTPNLDVVGLADDNPLHAAVKNAVVLQAAFRALLEK